MEMQKKGKIMNALAVAVFTVIRVVMFSYFPNVSDKTPYILFGTLLAAYAVLTAVVFVVLSKKSDNKADGILLLIFADFFFTMQSHSLALLTAIIWEAYVLIAVSEKNSNVKAVLLVAVALISALLMPYTLFSYALLAVSVYFIVNFRKSTFKTVLFTILTAVAGAGGFLINSFFLKSNTDYVDFINKYTLGKYGQDVAIGFAVCVPMLAVAVVLLAMLARNSKKEEKTLRTTEIKNAKKEKAAYIVVAVIMLATSIGGFLIRQIDMYMLVNVSVPVMLVALLLNKNVVAEKIFARVNSFVSEHSFIALVIFVVIFGIQAYCLNKTGIGGTVRGFINKLILQ